MRTVKTSTSMDMFLGNRNFNKQKKKRKQSEEFQTIFDLEVKRVKNHGKIYTNDKKC